MLATRALRAQTGRGGHEEERREAGGEERVVRAFAAETEHEHAALRLLLTDIQHSLERDGAGCASSCQTELTLFRELGKLISEVRSTMELEDTLLAMYQVQDGSNGAGRLREDPGFMG